jgi:hypothetical protein
VINIIIWIRDMGYYSHDWRWPTGGREAARSPGGAPAVRGGGTGKEEKLCGSPRRSGVDEVVGRGWRGGVPTVEDGSRGRG